MAASDGRLLRVRPIAHAAMALEDDLTRPAGEPGVRAGPSRLRLGVELARILGAVAIGLAVVTGLAMVLGAAGVDEPSRTARKSLVPLFIVIYAVLCGVRRTTASRDLGLSPWRVAPRDVVFGVAAGALSLVLLNAVLLAAGARRIDLDLPALRLALKIAISLGGALVLAVLEETTFRGLLFRRLQLASGTAAAVLLGSALFALAHFLEPPARLRPVDPAHTGFACLAGVADAPAERWKELIGLFLVGLVLSILRVRTGSIWLALGVHAGWVWVRQSADRILGEVDAVVHEHLFVMGTKRHYDGLAGWIALAATLAIVAALRRRSLPCRPPEC